MVAQYPSLVDIGQAEVDERSLPIIEVLNETNSAIREMPWIEANGRDGHKARLRTSIPAPSWTVLYQGVDPTKAGSAVVKDPIGGLSAMISYDQRLFEAAADKERFLAEQLRAHMEGFAQEFSNALFYANTNVNPERILGLAPRYGAKNARNGDYILDAGGTGSSLYSMWVIAWNPLGITGVYPKGMPAGIQRRELGTDTATDSSGRIYPAKHLWIDWLFGLHVADYRYAVRIANIDPSTFNTTSVPDLPYLVAQAYDLLPSTSNPVYLYGNVKCLAELRRQYAGKIGNSTLSFEEINGRRYQTTPEGFLMRREDALNTFEAQVV